MKKTTLMCLFLSAFLASCDYDEPDPSESPVRSPKLIFNHVITHHTAMSVGIDYNTKQAVVLDPLNGKIIQPCNQITAETETTYSKFEDSKAPSQNTNIECNSEIVNDNAIIQNVLNITQEFPTIPIKVRKADGSIVDATAIVSVNVLYPGSHCQSYYSGGKKTTNCNKPDKDYCKTIEPAKDICTDADKKKCKHFWK